MYPKGHLLHSGHLAGQYLEDFFQPPDILCLKTLLAYLGLNMPGLDPEHHALLLLSQLELLEPTEAETEGEEDLGWVMWVCVEGMGLGKTT